MRTAFSTALIQAAQRDARIVLLTGDHGYTLFDEFRRACPAQFINAGVAEQNMVGVAAGLAKGGIRPIVYGLSAFVPVRVLEQIKLDVCYERLPVVFIGDGAGVVYGTLGASHQSTEDIAALRALPEMAILSPCDATEMTACMDLALSANRPVYVRMGKCDVGSVHASPPQLQWGMPIQVREGNGAFAWIATGSMVATALSAAEHWPHSAVWSTPAIKPLDEPTIAAICQAHRVVVVLEEHSIYGGLGSAVAEISASHVPRWVCRIGVPDQFSAACGSWSYLMGQHGLDCESVVARVTEFLAAAGLTHSGAVRRQRTLKVSQGVANEERNSLTVHTRRRMDDRQRDVA